MPKPTIAYTYSTITEESARDGDYADHGYAAPGGWQFSMLEESVRADVEANPDEYSRPWKPGDLREAITFAREKGCTEPDNTYREARWFSSTDPDVDYHTGEDTYYSVHFNGFSPATMRRIARAISA